MDEDRVVQLVHGLTARGEMQDLEAAAGWVVVVHDVESGHRQAVGPFGSPVDALGEMDRLGAVFRVEGVAAALHVVPLYTSMSTHGGV